MLLTTFAADLSETDQILTPNPFLPDDTAVILTIPMAKALVLLLSAHHLLKYLRRISSMLFEILLL